MVVVSSPPTPLDAQQVSACLATVTGHAQAAPAALIDITRVCPSLVPALRELGVPGRERLLMSRARLGRLQVLLQPASTHVQFHYRRLPAILSAAYVPAAVPVPAPPAPWRRALQRLLARLFRAAAHHGMSMHWLQRLRSWLGVGGLVFAVVLTRALAVVLLLLAVMGIWRGFRWAWRRWRLLPKPPQQAVAGGQGPPSAPGTLVQWTVAALQSQGLLPRDDSRTNREYWAHLVLVRAPVADSFLRLVVAAEPACYGGQTLAPKSLLALQDLARSLIGPGARARDGT